MRFEVPQFIEVEDKIFGPLSIKQFIYLGGTVGLVFVFFGFLPRFLAILISLPVIAFGVALAFYKSQGQSFVNTLEAWVRYSVGSKLYVWQKQPKKIKKKDIDKKESLKMTIPKLSDSKLADLSWSLDVKDKFSSD